MNVFSLFTGGAKRPETSPVTTTAASTPEPDVGVGATSAAETTQPSTTTINDVLPSSAPVETSTTTSTGEPSLVGTLAGTSKPPIPPSPGVPVAFERTATSLTLAWSEQSTGSPPDYDFVLESPNPAIEYELRFYRAGYKYDSWTSVGVVTCQRWIRVEGLLPNQGYIFQVRSRYRDFAKMTETIVAMESVNLVLSRENKIPASACKWSTPSGPSRVYATLLLDEQERIENLGRLRQFIIDGAEGLPVYPEDPEVPDTYGAKAARTMDGLVQAVSQTGLGGAYFALVQGAWKIHKTGLASLIFHPDLQQTVYVLLNFLNIVAGENGLTSRDVVVGSYFALWEAKRERLLHPEAEGEEHEDGRPGVLANETPQVLLNELMFYFPLAGMAYRRSPAEIQWVLHKFTAADPKNTYDTKSKASRVQGAEQRGFRLILARTRSAKFQPAFFLAAHEELKTAVFVIRGTHELDDFVTDGLCDVQEAAFKFGDDSREFHVHAGMLQAAKWLVRGDDRRRHFEEDWANSTKTSTTKTSEEAEDDLRDGAGVGAAVAKLWAAGYRRVVLTGHSLGGGVAAIAALLLADKFRELQIQVYSYGTPAVVDETLAEACKGEHGAQPLVKGLGSRVTIKNIVSHDDLVPRLSLLTARDFALHLRETRSKWGPLLNEDIASFTQRIKTVWAPVQRAQAVKRPVGRIKKLTASSSVLAEGTSSDSKVTTSVAVTDGISKSGSESTDVIPKGAEAAKEANAQVNSTEEMEVEAEEFASKRVATKDNMKRPSAGDTQDDGRMELILSDSPEEVLVMNQQTSTSLTATSVSLSEDATVGEVAQIVADRALRPERGMEEGEGGTSTASENGKTNETQLDAAKKRKMSKAQEEAKVRLDRAFTNRLVVPGLIVHTYQHHGTQRSSLVDFRFPPLRRISAFQNCIDDHRFDNIMTAVRSVIFSAAAREAGRFPPEWESLRDHMDDEEEWKVTCRVCTYPVSWHQTSSSEAYEIRATHHCYSCGKIVCSKCSEGRVSLPHMGIIDSVRVCDLCKYHLFEPKTGQKNMFDFDEF